MTSRASTRAAPALTRARQPAGSRQSRPPTLDVVASEAWDAHDDSRVSAPAGADFAGVVTHWAGAAVFDDDAARAHLTRLLLEALAPRLGLDPRRIVVRTDASARVLLNAANAVGLQRDGTLFLHPARYRPERDSGRYLLAHELAHAAQRYGDGAAAAPEVVEADAHRIARALVHQRSVPRPAVALAPGAAAALSAAEVEAAADVAAAMPEEKALAPQDARDALEGLVARTRQAELARMIELLSYGVFDWAITDSDVTAVLRVLMTVSIVTARALVAALPLKYRRRLLENLDTVHYCRQREQVLAAWWGCTATELEPYSERLRRGFEAMDLRRLDPLEAAAAKHALSGMARAQRQQLLDGRKRDEIGTLNAFVPDARDEARSMASALQEERKLRSERAAAEAAFEGGPRAAALQQLVHLIIDVVERRAFRGSDAIDILKMLMPYVQRRAELRAIADHLAGVKVIASSDPKGKPEYEERRDHLEDVIRRVPIRALYASEGLERVYFLLLSFRPPYKNAQLAAEKTDESRFVLIDLLMKILVDPFVDRVTSEDAYLAFLLVKAMPPDARRAFFSFDQGARWTMVMKKMSQQQRESAAMNLFGGDEADVGRNAILSQLLADEIWKAEGAQRLDALIRIAIAAGEHRFVFDQSEQRQAHAKPWLKPLVDKYRLFDPHAKGPDGAPRTRYRREVLEGTPWYSGGWLIGGAYTAAQGLDFVFKSDDVEVATTSVGGRGLNLAELQDMFGGNFLGARFSDQYSYERGKHGEPDRGVNFANVKCDTRLGLLTMRSPDLEIEAIRYPIDDFLLQTGKSSVRGLEVSLAYGTDKRREPTRIDLTIDALVVQDVALIAADEMMSINRVDLETLKVHAGAPGSGATSPQRPREGLKVPLPIVGIPLGGAWNLFLGSLWNSLAGLFGAAPKAGISGSATELADQLLAAKAPMGFRLQIGLVRISGFSTSGGQFIESLELGELVLQGGGDPRSYRTALKESLARIELRLAGLRKEFGRAGADRRDALSLRIRALMRQKSNTAAELVQLTVNEAEVERLESLPKSALRPLTAHERLRLRQLKAQLSGAVLDIGRVSLKGLAGIASGEFSFADVHGAGRSVDNALGLFTDSEKLKNFVTGVEGRPVLSQGAGDPGEFTLDIGHADLPALTIKSALPGAVDAARDYQQFRAKHDPWRPSHVQELARLAERKALAAQREALLTDPGLGRLSGAQQKLFRESERRLERLEAQAALTIGRVVLDGAALTVSGERQIGLRAEHLVVEELRKGGLGVRRIEGSHVEVGIDIRDGVTGFDDRRHKLERLGIKGENVSAFGITQQDAGLSIDRATLMGIDEASLDFGAATARVTTKLVLVEGVRLRNSEEMLGRERDYLRGLAERTAKQEARLAAVNESLAALDVLRREVAESAAAQAKARTAKQADDARQRREEAQRQLDRWAEGLVAGSLALTDLDIDVLGLTDVLSPSFDPRAAGLEVRGRGGRSGRRLFSGATGTKLGIPGLSAGTVRLGETGGSVKLTNAGTQLDGIHLDSIDLEGLDWRGGQQHAFANGPVQLQSVDVTALIGDDQIAISSLEIGAISAEQVGYEDESTGLQLLVEAGALGGVHVTNLAISRQQTADRKKKTTVLGDVKVDSLSNLKLDALVDGLRMKGTLRGTGLQAQFVSDRKRAFRIGSLGLDFGRITEPGTTSSIHFSFAGLGLEVTQETLDDGATQYRLDDVVLADFDLGQCRWSGSGWVIAVAGGASLHGVTMKATVLQAKPTAEGKAGKIEHFTINEMRVAQAKARDLHLHTDARPAKTEHADKGGDPRDIDLEEATILGLEIRGIDVMKDLGKMTGKVTVHDSIDVRRLRIAIGEAGKDQLVVALSTKAYGKEASDAGLRGRELSAELFGRKGAKIQIGTVKEISGDFAGLGVKTGFATGQVTMSPIEFDGVAGEAHVTDVRVQGPTLTSPRYADGKGTEIKLDAATATAVTLKDVRAKFGELTDDKGKKSQGLTNLAIEGLAFDFIDAEGFEYTGKTTLAGGDSKTRTVSAQRAKLTGLVFDSLSHDFAARITKLDARLDKASMTSFAARFAETIGGKSSELGVFGKVESGAMHAALTLSGTRSGSEDWASLDGLFELTDPAHGLGLSNARVEYKEGSGGKLATTLLLEPSAGRTGGFDLTGLKVHFAPNGVLFFEFDQLAARALHVEAGQAKVDLDFGALRKVAATLQGQAPGQALDILGAKAAELEVQGVKVTYVVERGAPAAAAGGPGTAPSAPWKLDALSAMSGDLQVSIGDAKWNLDADIAVPIRHGAINFDDVAIEHLGPDSAIGIDGEGIYVDGLGLGGLLFRNHVYEEPNIPGATRESYDTDGEHTYIDHRGSLDLKVFLEDTLNASPSPAGSASPPKQLESRLRRMRIRGTVSPGDDIIGTSKGQVTLSGRSLGKNQISISAAKLGDKLELRLPEFAASQGRFELLDRPGQTGRITANVAVEVTGLGNAPVGGRLTFAITLTVVDGKVRDIEFGNVGLANAAAARALPPPRKDK